MGAGYNAAAKFNDIRYRAGDEKVEIGSKIAALLVDTTGVDSKYETPSIEYGRAIVFLETPTGRKVWFVTEDDRILWTYYPQTCVSRH